ncbi:MAG: cell division protein ZapA [Spirochaetaceae bacterium]|nr:cell division protein ZapA [Spirochaetaceae bacterium]MCF7949529.1 cell division protein ZapA [Spirochaetia bacterium]MCF7952134.1 cell division protein ZapA [Spirochaetaceae bacterium]
MEGDPVRIHLLGTSFTIKTNENPEYVQQLVYKVEKRFEQIRKSMGVTDPLRTAIISSILTVDELQRLQQQSVEAESVTLDLIELIDRTIE